MTLFIANGELRSVGKADCPRCLGEGFRFAPVGFNDNDTLRWEFVPCNCVEVIERKEA